MRKKEFFVAQIAEWGYAYCATCGRVRYGFELEATARGIRCSKCKGYKLEQPLWVFCPHRRNVVKCAVAGRGIVKGEYRLECEDRCRFLVP